MQEDFITIQEAAQKLGKSTQTIRRMIKRGDLTAIQIATPQGFHYVIPRESIDGPVESQKVSEVKDTPLSSDPDDTDEMLHRTPVEKSIEAQEHAESEALPIQTEMLINQHGQQPHIEAKSEGVDKKELAKVLERHHRETMLMINVIQKLQAELDRERRKPRSFLGYFFDWLSH